MSLQIIMSLIIAYLIGSIPFGLLVTRWAGLGDIRQFGSGNIGATNVMRKGGKRLGLLTLALDAGKGIAAVLLATAVGGEEAAYYAMPAAMLGHCFPLWLRFKGGKGIATALGVIAAYYHIVSPTPFFQVLLPLASIWIATLLLSRYVSLASLVAALCLPLITAIACGLFSAELVMSALIIVRHRANIGRLRRGEEHRISPLPKR